MKQSKRYLVRPEKLHSLKDIEVEKQRLRLEILKTENNIRMHYHNITGVFTLKNMASHVVGDISGTASVIQKAFHAGRIIFSKKKKKKEDKRSRTDGPAPAAGDGGGTSE